MSPLWKRSSTGVRRKHGAVGRVWVFDRGIVSEENLALLRRRGLFYLVATPRRMLGSFEKELLKEDWSEVEGHPQIQVKLVARERGTLCPHPELESGRERTRDPTADAAWLAQRSGQAQQGGTQRPSAPSPN
jgi:hypothetical protein